MTLDLNTIASVQIDGAPSATFSAAEVDVIIVPPSTATEIDVVTDSPVPLQLVEVLVPGFQGPPGLQNVYIQSAQPTDPNLNDVWIQI